MQTLRIKVRVGNGAQWIPISGWELPPLGQNETSDLTVRVSDGTHGQLKVNRVDSEHQVIYVRTTLNDTVVSDGQKRQLLEIIEQWIADVNYGRVLFENSFPRG